MLCIQFGTSLNQDDPSSSDRFRVSAAVATNPGEEQFSDFVSANNAIAEIFGRLSQAG